MEESVLIIKELLKLELSSPTTTNNEGETVWKLPNGFFHRKFGPAIECPDGSKEWFLNGELHRADGPAIEYPDGSKEYWINGIEIDELEFIKLKNNT